jgi:hypothetical protein
LDVCLRLHNVEVVAQGELADVFAQATIGCDVAHEAAECLYLETVVGHAKASDLPRRRASVF